MSADDFKPKARVEPRISLNKLAEYLSTNKAARRERILHDQKYPPTFQVIRYDAARQIMQQLLASGKCNSQEIQAKILEMTAKKPSSDYDERMIKANVEALSFFIDIVPSLSFLGHAMTLGAHAPASLRLSGVDVSVRPDLIVTSQTKAGPAIGGVKFNVSKGAIHTKESSEYVGALMVEYLGQLGQPVNYALCSAIDVFGKKVMPAPKATANRMKDAVSACAEIARVWPAL